MKYFIFLTVIISIGIIAMSTSFEMMNTGVHEPSIRSLYKEDTSFLFFLDRSSSFYHFYSISEEPPYLSTRKIGHFFAYGILAAFLFFLIPIERFWLRGALAFSSSSLVGLIDEIHQHFLIDRSGRILDVYINTAGSFVFVFGLVVVCYVIKLVQTVITLLFFRRKGEHKKTA